MFLQIEITFNSELLSSSRTSPHGKGAKTIETRFQGMIGASFEVESNGTR